MKRINLLTVFTPSIHYLLVFTSFVVIIMYKSFPYLLIYTFELNILHRESCNSVVISDVKLRHIYQS